MQDVTPLIKLENVRVHYASESGRVRKAVDGVSLELVPGEWISIVGANGSGKSTLAGLLIGFTPLSGGERMASPGLVVRGVLQQPDAQVLGDTIEEEFHFALSSLLESPDEQLRRREHALHTVGLEHPPEAAISMLSGGQKQLLNIAVALAAKPDVLILDEPTAMLDPGARERMEAVVQTIVQQGTAVIWITHHLEEATLCDRIIAMVEGRCVYDGAPAAFFYGKDKEETAADAGKKVKQPSPCEKLGLAPPFTVQTALFLKQKGLLQHATPLRPEQLVKEVTLWQSN
ncbi:energy-coupling factor transport system ATP-binding protein [Paenibacillus pabuli]|uniref:Energy-coupling factor transport system ATP-binding protein n=1 Tax=Paenibacillus pabuli TaxID=1472 RepID=A0A855XVA4_9BACL|nr:energy-coupling factor transport system ATP-binding protein [Paenibacillus pabuli]PXW04140.1 energy-coupling factor transport system ATP-binding protein [Paenibacillus taichungensis]RAJ00620.1 energy-coupling factor transport system ATP-binding protein [Paenibacillus pabuli]